MSHLSFTEPILSIEGIEPVIAHYQSLFDKVRKDATEQIRLNVSSAMDCLFDVFVDYMKIITTKAYSVANHEHLSEKYVPLSLVESGARVMQTKLRQLMGTEMDATCSKLSELIKVPLRLPFNQKSYNDDYDNQQNSDARAILDQLKQNLVDISDVDDDEDDNENENEDHNKRKRNKQKRQTEVSCEKIAQMCVLIRKLERYQLTEQTMLLRRLQLQKKEQIDLQLKQQLIEQQLIQKTSSYGSTSSDFINNEHSQPSSNVSPVTNQHLLESMQSESSEQQLSRSPSTSSSESSSSSSAVHQSQNSISPAPKPVHLRLIQREPGVYQFMQHPSNVSMTTQQHSTALDLRKVCIIKPAIPSTCSSTKSIKVILSNPSNTNQASNVSNLPSSSPSEELFNSVTISNQNDDNESDDEVIFLKEIDSAANATNQNGVTVRDGEMNAQQISQPTHEQVGGNVHQSTLVSKRLLMDQHLLSVHHILPYNCLLTCGDKFATLEALNVHLTEQHREITFFSCKHHKFPRPCSSYIELFLHHDNRHPQLGVRGCGVPNCLFKIGWCDVMEVAQRSLDCGITECQFVGCGQKIVRSLRYVREHLLTHREDRPFVCSLCSESFKQKQNCRRHIRIEHFGGQVPSPQQVSQHVRVCDPVFEDPARPVQPMDQLFIEQKRKNATIVSFSPVQVPDNEDEEQHSSDLQESDSVIQSEVEDELDCDETNVPKVGPSTSASSTSNSLNNFGKRTLVTTSDETRIRLPDIVRSILKHRKTY